MTVVPRPSSSLVAFWAVAVVALLFLGDSIVRGNWHVFALALAPIGLLVWAAWMFLYRPRIGFDGEGIIVVNPGRIIRVPWQRVSAVRQRFQVVLDLDDGSRVTCWGSPFPEKPGRLRPDPASRSQVGGQIAGPLEAARSRSSASATDAEVERRWDLPALIIGAVLVLTCVVELVTAR